MIGSSPCRTGPDRESSTHRVRILVVDDSRDILEFLELDLSLLGYQVTAVPDGPSAIRSARLRAPDLIVTDIRMPGMDGFDLLHSIRGCCGLIDVPVIALTASSSPLEVERTLEHGFAACLAKPAGLDRLSDVIREHLS